MVGECFKYNDVFLLLIYCVEFLSPIVEHVNDEVKITLYVLDRSRRTVVEIRWVGSSSG